MRSISKINLPIEILRKLNFDSDTITFTAICEADGYPIKSFSELRELAAMVAVINPSLLIFFRGQKEDYKRGGKTTIIPSIYRGPEGSGSLVSKRELDFRWRLLDATSNALLDLVQNEKHLINRELIRWSLLQHYEASLTPLLDITQSLRVACSFATLDNQNDTAYIYLIGLPYFHNRVSRNSEEELTNIRLLSICPPMAQRPYLQEGYLVGEEDIKKGESAKERFDLRRRIVAKFKITNTNEFWGEETPLKRHQLYPENDCYLNLCKEAASKAAEILKGFDMPFADNEIVHFISVYRKIEKLLHSNKHNPTDINQIEDEQLSRRVKLTKRLTHVIVNGAEYSTNRLMRYFNEIDKTYEMVKQYFEKGDRR